MLGHRLLRWPNIYPSLGRVCWDYTYLAKPSIYYRQITRDTESRSLNRDQWIARYPSARGIPKDFPWDNDVTRLKEPGVTCIGLHIQIIAVESNCIKSRHMAAQRTEKILTLLFQALIASEIRICEIIIMIMKHALRNFHTILKFHVLIIYFN